VPEFRPCGRVLHAVACAEVSRAQIRQPPQTGRFIVLSSAAGTRSKGHAATAPPRRVMNSRRGSIRRCANKNRGRKTMHKSLQSALVALAAGSIFVFASAAMAQDASVGLSPLFEVQPQVAQEYAP